MKKLQLLMVSLLLPVFMGHAKKTRHGFQFTSMHQGQGGQALGANPKIVNNQIANSMAHSSLQGMASSSSRDKASHQAGKDGMLIGFGASVGLAGVNNKAIAVQKDGKFIVIAQNSGSTNFTGSVTRYSVDGTPEVIFENPSYLSTTLPGYSAQAVAVTSNQNVIVGYTNNNSYALVRYHQDGTIDQAFNFSLPAQTMGGKMNALALQQDGKIVVGSTSSTMPLARFYANGMFDMNFAPDNTQANLSSVTALSIQTGKVKGKSTQMIVAAGTTKNAVGSVPANTATLVRYGHNGMVDQWFNFSGVPAGLTNVKFLSLAGQANNQTVVAGSSNKGALLLRVNATGALDAAFSSWVDGTTDNTPNSAYNSVVVDEKNHNEIVVAGQANGNSSIVRRYSTSGALNTKTFGDQGTVTLYDGTLSSLALTDKDGVLLAGKIQSGSTTSPVMYKI